MTAPDSTPETTENAPASDADGGRPRTRTRSRQTAKDRAVEATSSGDTSSDAGEAPSGSGDDDGSTRRRRPRRGRRGRGGRRKGAEGEATTDEATSSDDTKADTAADVGSPDADSGRDSGKGTDGDSDSTAEDASADEKSSDSGDSTAKASTTRTSTSRSTGEKTSRATSTAKKSTAKKSTAKKSGAKKSGGSSSSGADDERIRQGGTRLAAKRSRNGGGGSRRVSGISEELRRQMLDGPPKTMLVSVEPERTQIAILEERTLVEHNVTHRSDVTLVGNIYMARVQNVLPGMEAAFLDIGKGRNGVLYAGEVLYDDLDIEEGDAPRIEDALKSGQKVLVQVTKDAMGTKGPRLTMQLSLAGRYTVLAPNSDVFGISRKLTDKERDRLRKIVKKVKPSEHGVIVRTAAEGIPEEQLIADLERLLAKWAGIEERAAAAKALSVVYEEPPLHVKVIRDSFGPDFATCIIDDLEVHDAVRGYLDEVAPDLAEKIELYGMARYERDHAAAAAVAPEADEAAADAPATDESADAPEASEATAPADAPDAAPPAPTEPVAEGDRPRFAPLFDAYNVNDQLRKAMARKVWLPSGGYLIIESTEAMKVIDVNTGKYTGSKKTSLEEVVLKTNLEAAEEIVRQLRLRDIGGIIIIDFIDMLLKANQDQVVRRLKRELLRDRTKTRVSEVSRLGLVQMTRKNVSAGLVESFSHTCEQCEGRGFVNDFDA